MNETLAKTNTSIDQILSKQTNDRMEQLARTLAASGIDRTKIDQGKGTSEGRWWRPIRSSIKASSRVASLNAAIAGVQAAGRERSGGGRGRSESNDAKHLDVLGTIGWGTKVSGENLERLFDTFRSAAAPSLTRPTFTPAGFQTGPERQSLGQIVRRRNDLDRVILALRAVTRGSEQLLHSGTQFFSPEVKFRASGKPRTARSIRSIFFLIVMTRACRLREVGSVERVDSSGASRAIGASNWTSRAVSRRRTSMPRPTVASGLCGPGEVQPGRRRILRRTRPCRGSGPRISSGTRPG